jgi:hypothetical protein
MELLRQGDLQSASQFVVGLRPTPRDAPTVTAKWPRGLPPPPTPIARAPTAVGYATAPGRTPTRAAAAPDLHDVGCSPCDDIGRQRCRVRSPCPRRRNADHPNQCECSQLHPAPPSKPIAGLYDAATRVCAAAVLTVLYVGANRYCAGRRAFIASNRRGNPVGHNG